MPRVLFPSTGFTTADAAAYYRAVAKWLLPHLRNVPVSFKRYPDTTDGESFWEKDAPSFTPSFVKTFAVPRRNGPDIHYILINDLRTLTWLAETGGIELHPFLHRAPDIARPTSIVFDLDPGEGASMVECCEVALLLRDALQRFGFETFAKVSGSKGLQVYAPVGGEATHPELESFARLTAGELEVAHPRLVTAKMGKQFRSGKVFIDWSQNADFKTTVSVYSLRAKRERPYVSMPLTWAEVAKRQRFDFEPDEAIARLQKRGDLFRSVIAKGRTTVPVAAPRERELRLPSERSQSGRRLFVLREDELLLESGGEFQRWTLRGETATPAGTMRIDKAWYHGEGDALDIGAYEVIEGSYGRGSLELWFTGRALKGRYVLERVKRSWRFRAAE